MAKHLVVVAFLISFALTCKGWPSGAPQEACGSMHPQHFGLAAQEGAPPFEIKATNNNDQTVIVEIIAKEPGRPFKGFLINAIDTNTQKVVGSFVAPPSSVPITEQYQTLTCGQTNSDTATHVSSAAKFDMTLVWQPDPGFSGQIMFRATVVEETVKFYTEIKSNIITI